MAGVLSSNEVVQLGFLVRDVEAAKRAWAEFLGTPVCETLDAVDTAIANTRYYGKPSPEAKLKAALYRLGENLFMELMQPNDAPSEWRDHLDQFGEGLHHIAFYVDEIEKEIEACERSGYPLIQKGIMIGESGAYAYADTKKKLKTTVEMLQCNIPMEEIIGDFVNMDPKYRTSSALGSNDVIQVAIVTRDAACTGREFAKFLGVPEGDVMDAVDTATAHTQYCGRPSPDAKLKASMYRIGKKNFVEIMQPDGGESVWWDHLDEYGEGIHHLAFEVKDMDSALEACEKLGYSVTQRGDMRDGCGRYAYIDSKKRLKVVIELLEFNGDSSEILDSLIK